MIIKQTTVQYDYVTATEPMYIPYKAFQTDQAVLPSTDTDLYVFYLLVNSNKNIFALYTCTTISYDLHHTILAQ